ncbi:glycoprotein [Hayes Yard virus]|uniref:Glycoprotein n=1 Tax=Hayes Yard virus TaxID=2602440 RepID=A0A7D0INA9_9RHAB|nr:glycoprotein [Hayes Yard virus]QEA08653.1 glycoprotein [Hayes Yard virus]
MISKILCWMALGQCLRVTRAETESRVFNVPVNCMEERPIKPTEIVCPKRYNELSLEAHHTLIEGEEKIEQICRPALRDDDHVDGYICREQHWETECEETWYFATVINYHIRETIPSPGDCISAVKQFKDGVLIPPYYPPAGCFWNTKIKETIKFMVLTRHKSILNPMDNLVHDSQFINPCDLKKTQKTGCKLKDVTGLWIPEIEIGLSSEHCSRKHWECIGIKSYKSELDEKIRIWEAPEIGIINITKSCKQSFCGFKGVVFDDGEWWGYANTTEDELIKAHVSDCKDRKPGIRVHNDHTDYETYDIRAEMENERCQNTISKILNSEPINTVDMSYLSPTRPGRDYAYRFKQVNWTETFCLRWVQTGLSKDCNKFWKYSDRGGKVTKDHVGIGEYTRALCEFRPIIDKDGDGYISKEELGKHNMSTSFSLMRLDKKGGNQGADSIEVGFNGIVRIPKSEKDGEKYMVRMTSVYDGLEQRNRLIKFEVLEFEDVVAKYQGEGNYDVNDKVVELIPDNQKNISRTDFVRTIANGGKEIISGIVGWFTGTAKIIRWTIWAIGALVTTYAIYKLHKLVRGKNKQESQNYQGEQGGQTESKPKWFKRGRREETPKKSIRLENPLYEEIDIDDNYSLRHKDSGRLKLKKDGFFDV